MVIETLDEVEYPLPDGTRVRCPFCERVTQPGDATEAERVLRDGCMLCRAPMEQKPLDEMPLLPGEVIVVEDENGVVDDVCLRWAGRRHVQVPEGRHRA